MPDECTILAINPGSTSTKFAVYIDERPSLVKNIRHSDADLAPCRGRPILEQQEFRSAQIEAALAEAGYDVNAGAPPFRPRLAEGGIGFDAVVGRGGLLPPVPSGTYAVTEAMLDELRLAKRGEHASNLGAFLAHAIAQKAGAQAYVVDPVSVDEWPEIARLSGSALSERQCLSHALNSKAVAKRYAREHGRAYHSLRLIVAHLGSGISVSAHEAGRMVDVTNSREEGAFSTERAGTVPVMQLVDLCFSQKYTRNQVEALLFREGGLSSYLGTKDLLVVEKLIASGDAHAATVFAAMVYQIAKDMGAMSTVLRGRVDAVLITGGMAHSQRLITALKERVSWIAPIETYPGEDELQALVEGVLRVLRRGRSARVRRLPGRLSLIRDSDRLIRAIVQRERHVIENVDLRRSFDGLGQDLQHARIDVLVVNCRVGRTLPKAGGYALQAAGIGQHQLADEAFLAAQQRQDLVVEGPFEFRRHADRLQAEKGFAGKHGAPTVVSFIFPLGPARQ